MEPHHGSVLMRRTLCHTFIRAMAAVVCLFAAGSVDRAFAGVTGVFDQGRATPASPVVERLARVRQSLFSGTADVPAAIRELKAILATDPGSHDAHVLLGI